MPQVDLHTLLSLVGTLDDRTDTDNASARFRAYLQDHIRNVSDVRAYTDIALSTSGDQYNKALQDLVNHVGRLLGFEVDFGRYRGVTGQIGFDGFWRSPTGRVVVTEVKTTDVYTVKTSTLLGYINDLVSAGSLQKPSQAIGLYVYGRFDSHTSQLENAIVAEGRQERLRVASVDTLLNLLELKEEYDIEHETVLQLLLPSPVRVDTIVNLIFDVVSQEKREAAERATTAERVVQETSISYDDQNANFYLLPASDSEDGTPVLENLHRWLDKGLWGLGERTGYRREFKPGDRVCFYAARIGVVVDATVVSEAFDLSKDDSPAPHLEVPYGMRLANVRWFEDSPVELTKELRAQLSTFQGRDQRQVDKYWSWFVQGTSKLTRRDFQLLTRGDES